MIIGGGMFIAGVLLVMAGCGGLAKDRMVEVSVLILVFGFVLGVSGVLRFSGLPPLMELP